MKNWLTKIVAIVAAITLSLAAAIPAFAQIELRFSPQDTTIAVGDSGRLSIMLDDAQEVRSFEVWVQCDLDILSSDGGSPGQAFLETGCQLFDGFEQDTSGVWHGYVVIMDAECWMTGPGELFTWDFSGASVGVSDVSVQDVALYAPQVGELPDVSLAGTTVTVSDGQVVVPGAEVLHLQLDVFPNPFNPHVTVAFTVTRDQRVVLDVYGMDGRHVFALTNHIYTTGTHTLDWLGRDTAGRQMASGTYIVQLKTKEGTKTRKAILVR